MTVAGHACHTPLETAICRDMFRQGLPHEHRSLRFRVLDAQGGSARYEPAIVARRGSILFLVEPVPSDRADETIERLAGFLEQHSPEIVLVAVTDDARVDEIPPAAYDEIYAASDIQLLTARIREQDPEGIVRPFVKPRPKARDRPRDAAK